MQRFRSLRRAAAVPVTALGLALLVTSSAQAASQVNVTYDLGGSTGTSTVSLPLIGDVEVALTPDNFSGTQTVRYQSDSASNIVSGPVSLISFNLTVNAPVTTTGGLQLATSTLYLRILGLPEGGGSLTGGVLDPQGNVATFTVTGYQHCLAVCAALGSGVTQSVPGAFQAITFTQVLPVLNTSTTAGDHVVTGTTTASFTLDPGDPSTKTTELVPVVAVTNLVGREVSRTPEPGSMVLGGTALGTVLVAGIGRRYMSRR